MDILIVIIGLFFGANAFSKIIFPLFSDWPLAKRLEREEKLIKPIPIKTFIVAPMIWGVLLAGSIWIVNYYFPESINYYYVVLGCILVGTIASIPKQNRDLEANLKDSWKQYLRKQ